MLAMCRAVARLPAAPDLVLVDGNQPPALACPVRCVVGGDALSLSIAAASIVAKVLRDRAMKRLAAALPRLWLGGECRLRHARRTGRRCATSARPAITGRISARSASWPCARSRRGRLTRLARAGHDTDLLPRPEQTLEIARELPLDQILLGDCRAADAHVAVGLGGLRLRRSAV